MFQRVLKHVVMATALLAAGGCSSAPLADVQSLPRIAQSKHYNVFVLEATSGAACLHQEFYTLLNDKYGDQLLTWSVQEVDALHYVYAYPPDTDPKQNMAQADELESFVEAYPEDTTCSRIRGFEAHFPMLDNTER